MTREFLEVKLTMQVDVDAKKMRNVISVASHSTLILYTCISADKSIQHRDGLVCIGMCVK